MATGLAVWSETASNNATVDSTVNWQEGQAPSSVNDSARAMMASAAKWRDDISGLIVSTGTSTAFTITSRQGFASLAAMDGLEFGFTPHTTCGASPTLSIDGLSGQPIMAATGQSIPAGTLLAGTPYSLLYNNATNSFYLNGFFGNPYNIPIGASLEYWSLIAPNSSFAFPTGQAISRTTYSALFALIGTLYGSGDGSTTFNLPNKTGRASVMRDPSHNFINTTFNSTELGGIGGNELSALVTGNLPPYTPSGSVPSVSVASTSQFTQFAGNVSVAGGGNPVPIPNGSNSTVNSTGSGTFSGNAQGGNSTAFSNVQPSIICNCIMRII